MSVDVVKAGGFGIPVLYEDNHLLVVVKPPNMIVQADQTGDIDLLTALKGYIGEKYHKPGAVYLGLVHRLDRPAGGVMVFARTSKAAARLTEQFSKHTARKTYIAVIRGTPEGDMHLTDWLRKGDDGMVRVVNEGEPGAKKAVLTSHPEACVNGNTLVTVQLETGRAHQIRVQHAHAGYPLWGDARYGGGKPGQQLALWARELTIMHPTQKAPVTFTYDPPETGIWQDFTEYIHE